MHNSEKSVIPGCLNVFGDGNIGVHEERSAGCLQDGSIKRMKAAGGDCVSHTPQSLSQSEGVREPIGAIRERSAKCLQASSNNTKPADGDCESPAPQSLSLHEGEEGTEDTAQTDPLDGNNQNNMKKAKKKIHHKGNRKGLKVATLNIHGKEDKDGNGKYRRLTTIMRKERIAILATQETRLNEEEVNRLERENPKIRIESNGNSTSKEGVAFIMNEELLTKAIWNHTIVVPGRVSRLEIEWSAGNKLNIINIYMPNNTLHKIKFLENLIPKLEELELQNTIIMGDWNCVESDIDRYPCKRDDNRITNLITRMKTTLKVVDGWRINNPNEKSYSFFQEATGSSSRIDRIYMRETLSKQAYNWTISTSATLSDHEIVSVEIMKKHQPFVGKGLWRMREDIIQYKPFVVETAKILKDTQDLLTGYEAECQGKNETTIIEMRKHNNPQIIWEETKIKLRKAAQQCNKERNKQLNSKMKQIKDLLTKLENRRRRRTKDNAKIKKLREELRTESNRRTLDLQNSAAARYRKYGESCTKYWFRLNKPTLDPQIIMALQKVNGSTTIDTREMAEIASQYHEKLQTRQEWTEERSRATDEILNKLDKKLTEEEQNLMARTVDEHEIAESLRNCANGKTPGCDGITFEFWKYWAKAKRENPKGEKEVPDIIKMLGMLYNDIEKYGIMCESFVKAGMTLIYKKKDIRRIENYRPISLVNTDYKILTKIIATKLGQVVKTIVHPNQAGFIPGRGLQDHTRTTQTIIEYCELTGKKGCIVALDQEKAYDKIDHTYLWKVLEKFGFPKQFINLIQNLYKDAKTSVIVNGIVAKPIKVDRGVRQGDPVSCILYDIAIEPLANEIRKSKLKGIKTSTIEEPLKATLFADDTLIYLSKGDQLKEMKRVVDLFCKASTAKFNLEKTEYLPVGPKQYREKLYRTRKFGREAIEEGITIIKDGEPMRTLGAWVGNMSDTRLQWDRILEQQQKIMDTWSKMNLPFGGKELVLKALIQSRALFLATVNGMPKDIMHTMKKQMRSFMWNGKRRGDVMWESIIRRRDEGGLGIPDIEARVDAIQVMWLKKWTTTTGKDKPLWAHLTDEIIMQNIPDKPMVEELSSQDWMLQNWHESMSRDSKISKPIREMLRVARKYNAGVEALQLSTEAKQGMPVWHHFAVNNNYYWNKKAARCLRQKHGISTVGDMETFVKNNRSTSWCDNNERCRQIAQTIMELLPEKFNPLINYKNKDELDHTPDQITKYKKLDYRETPIPFNPDVIEKNNARKAIRIFMDKKTYKKRKQGKEMEIYKPASRGPKAGFIERLRKLTMYTDGSTDKNGAENGNSGIGIWHRDGSARNTYKKIIGPEQTNQRAELMAIIAAVEKDETSTMTIISDSETCIKGILHNITKWEDKAWINTKNKEEWKYLAYRLRKRKGKTLFKWIKGHSISEENKKADELADKGAKSQETYNPNLQVPKEWTIEGARLSSLTQGRAYNLILKQKTNKTNLTTESTKSRIEGIKDEIERVTKWRPSEGAIWTGLLNKKINKRISDFIWKIIHGRNKCGRFFEYVPNKREQQFCHCGQIETIQHILLECSASGIEMLWNFVQRTWGKTTTDKWIEPSTGIIGGIGALIFRDKDNKVEKLRGERYKIFITETIWMIWKARNGKIFSETPMTGETLVKDWKKTIEKRITLDFEIIKIEEIRKRDKKSKELMRLWEGIVTIENGKTLKITW